VITKDQIYRSCDPRGGPTIRIVSYTSGLNGAEVVDAHSGKQPRRILARNLHDSATTKAGQPRRTGYALVAEPAPVDGWLPNLTNLPLGELNAQLDDGLAGAVGALLDGVERSMTTTAGSSGS
jgi:hypothetical protein